MSSFMCDQVVNLMNGDDKKRQSGQHFGPMSLKSWSVSRVKKKNNNPKKIENIFRLFLTKKRE